MTGILPRHRVQYLPYGVDTTPLMPANNLITDFWPSLEEVGKPARNPPFTNSPEQFPLLDSVEQFRRTGLSLELLINPFNSAATATEEL
jgi:hypothetical protein